MNKFFNSKKLKDFFLIGGNPFLRGTQTNTPVPPPLKTIWVESPGIKVVDENNIQVLAP